MAAEHGSPVTRRARREGARRLRRIERRILVMAAAVALLVGVGGGTAVAYLSASGTGSGAASVGKAGKLVVLYASGTTTSDLYPGGTADLLLKLKNPNTFPVTIVGISEGTGEVQVDNSGHSDGTDHGNDCTAENAGVSANTKTVSITVTPGYQTVHVATGAHMATTSANACQGASFHIPVTLTAEQG